MCLSPIKIKNRRKNIEGNMPFECEVPCGHCAECLQEKRNEYYFRCYYEAQSTFDSGGYVYFDTLTYRDEQLPHMSEFTEIPDGFEDSSCFDVRDYRLFFVRLRRELSRLGYDVAHNLKYFLTSEYGTEEGKTHRPHYHVLFFIKKGFVDALTLSRLVNMCWVYGRTDGLGWKSQYYVLKHVFGPAYNNDCLHMQAVCNYVSKYVTKESHFEEIVEDRINDLFVQRHMRSLDVSNVQRWSVMFKQLRAHYLDAGISLDKVRCRVNRDLINEVFKDDVTGTVREKYVELKKNMAQFHRQSNGFGEDFLKYNDYDEVFDTGMLRMCDRENIVVHIPIPTYYQRKLFYQLNKDFNGRATWELNQEGVKFKFHHTLKAVDLMADKFRDWQKNMEMHNYYYDGVDEDKDEWYDSKIKRFNELNGDRDLKDFAEYLLFYKGRVKSRFQRHREASGVYHVDDKVAFFFGNYNELKGTDFLLYNYSTKEDNKLFGFSFLTDHWLGDIHEFRDENVGMSDDVKEWTDFVYNERHVSNYTPNIMNFNENGKFGDLFTVNDFVSRYVINETADPKFVHYDEMYDIWCRSQFYKNRFKKEGFTSKDDLKFRLSVLRGNSI